MRRLLLLVVGLVSVSTTLSAQSITSPYRYLERGQSVLLYGGYLATDRGDLDLGPHSAPLVGARYAGRFSGPLSGVAGVGFLPSSRTVYAMDVSDSALVALGDVDMPLLFGEVGLQFNITGPRSWHALTPYLGATAGLIIDLAGTSSLEEENEVPEEQLVDFGPALAVGGHAGIDWFLTDRFSVRGAGQAYLWRFEPPSGIGGDSGWLRNFGGTLGVAFHF